MFPVVSNFCGIQTISKLIYPEIHYEKYMKLHIHIDDLLGIFFHVSAKNYWGYKFIF